MEIRERETDIIYGLNLANDSVIHVMETFESLSDEDKEIFLKARMDIRAGDQVCVAHGLLNMGKTIEDIRQGESWKLRLERVKKFLFFGLIIETQSGRFSWAFTTVRFQPLWMLGRMLRRSKTIWSGSSRVRCGQLPLQSLPEWKFFIWLTGTGMFCIPIMWQGQSWRRTSAWRSKMRNFTRCITELKRIQDEYIDRNSSRAEFEVIAGPIYSPGYRDPIELWAEAKVEEVLSKFGVTRTELEEEVKRRGVSYRWMYFNILAVVQKGEKL